MGIWSDILNLVLLATALAAVLWGVRQRAVYRRVEEALRGLRDGRRPAPLQRSPADSEPVLQAFDRFLETYSPPSAERPSTAETEMGQVLSRLCQALKPPLTAIQNYANSLSPDSIGPAAPPQQESVQNLRLHVNGLLRLIESSATLSELRQGLSGFQRQMTAPPAAPPATEAPIVLLVDDEGAWSQELARATAEGGWKLLTAPGVDAVRTMAASMHPQAAFVNAGRGDGFGWRSLAALRRGPAKASPPVVLYGLDEKAGLGRAWAPTDVWLWPLSQDLASFAGRWRDGGAPARFSLHGDPELTAAAAEALRSAGVEATVEAAEPVVVLDPCCTLLILRDAPQEEEVAELGQILIVDEAKIQSSADALAREFNESRWLRWMEVERLRSDMVERLYDLAKTRASAEAVEAAP